MFYFIERKVLGRHFNRIAFECPQQREQLLNVGEVLEGEELEEVNFKKPGFWVYILVGEAIGRYFY